MRGGPADSSAVVAVAEAAYAAAGQPCLFRVPDLVPGMDGPLDRLGYTADAALGFATELYRYHYRRQPVPAA